MAELIYIDTNIYLDYWENRIDKMRPLGEFAYNVIKRAISCEFIVVISNLLLQELGNHLNQQNINKIFEDLNRFSKLELVAVLEDEIKEARILAQKLDTGKNDAIHALVAKRAGAKYIVTRNLKDFEGMSDLIQPILPENI